MAHGREFLLQMRDRAIRARTVALAKVSNLRATVRLLRAENKTLIEENRRLRVQLQAYRTIEADEVAWWTKIQQLVSARTGSSSGCSSGTSTTLTRCGSSPSPDPSPNGSSST